jgi:integrase
MARRPKPWLRKGRGWFVTLDGKQVSLGVDKNQAHIRFHQLMSEPKPPTNARHPLVASVLDEFLEWTKNNREIATYESRRTRLQSFLDHLSSKLTVGELQPFHAQQWLDSHPNWASTTARTAVATVQRALTWAVKMGHIPSNPLAYFEKPAAEARDRIVTLEEYRQILAYTPDVEFRNLLTVHWEAGCRPQESLRVEAKFVDLKNARWVFPVKKSKGKRRPRIVYLNDEALGITQTLMLKWPNGPIFRNTRGRPWTKDSVNCRFERLEKKLGTKYCLYLFRHSFATRLLETGLDALTVAVLLGHSNPAMLSTTYQHLAHNPGHLLEQLKKASA